MSVKDEYLTFREINQLRKNNFEDSVLLQIFLRDRLEKIWKEEPKFTYGGLFKNHDEQICTPPL